MYYSRHFLLNIPNCWKVWNNSWRGSPVWQISSDVWARLKLLDLLAPRRGHRGGRSQSLFKDKRRIDVVNGRRSFNTTVSHSFSEVIQVISLTLLPTANMNNNGCSVTQWSRHELKPFRGQKLVWLTSMHNRSRIETTYYK